MGLLPQTNNTMPNWCNNKLTVENATEEFCDYLRECGFSFNKIVPVEQDQENVEKQVSEQVSAWSTKWDLDEDEQSQVAFELIENNVVYFDTAWSPPLNVIEVLSEKFPTMDFRLDYCELGCWFAGTFYASNGIGIDESCEDDEELKAFCAEVFDHEFLDDEEDEQEETDEGFVFGSDFNTDARNHSLSSYDPDDEE